MINMDLDYLIHFEATRHLYRVIYCGIKKKSTHCVLLRSCARLILSHDLTTFGRSHRYES